MKRRYRPGSRRTGPQRGRGRTGVATLALALAAAMVLGESAPGRADVVTPVPEDQRGTLDAERSGFHDANNMRTVFWNYGMVGDYPPDPGNVDLSVFHSVEVPRGSGMNYSDGVTPFVLAEIILANGTTAHIMETGFRERQGVSPYYNRDMRFEPRPGYFQPDPNVNAGRSPAISNDPRTWPDSWPDRLDDPNDPGWPGSWNGYFGKAIVADQESYMVLDDDFYDAWDFTPDSRDSTRRGLGLRIEVRGFQWANPQARNVIFWHYDITNEGTTDYDDNIIFGLYMDSGVGGSALSCDGIYESDDDNAFFNRSFDENVINLVYTWDRFGHGRDLSGPCGTTGYLGYAYLETPGNSFDTIDNDEDGILNERRDSGPGQHLVGLPAIDAYLAANYDVQRFEATYGPLADRPAYRIESWWTGDEDMDWVPELHDTGADGVFETGDSGENDGEPTEGEPNFDGTDLNESDQIGLTGFKINRIRPGQGNPNQETDDIVFFTNRDEWPRRLYEQFSDPDSAVRFGEPIASNYNIGFLFASGPFQLKAGQTERFSLALAYGADLSELRRTVQTVQQIYDSNYRFATPPKAPTVTAETGDGFARLSWDDVAERSADPVTGEFDFEGYRIYRSTDPAFLDVQLITTGTGSGPIGNGRPIAQFDLINGRQGFSEQTVEGVSYYLGTDSGITHTWTDYGVTNGQRYYYAVTAYDRGTETVSGAPAFYPSENAISVSVTPRGGTILPRNVVEVRPNPKVAGWLPAEASEVTQTAGRGVGTVSVEVVNSGLIPDGHVFEITFATPSPDSFRARTYALTDSTAGTVLFQTGNDFDGAGTGTTGGGLLPIIDTAAEVTIDSSSTGMSPGSTTDGRFLFTYQTALPINQCRPGYPDDISIVFADAVVDTGLNMFPIPANPAKFRAYAHAPAGQLPLDFRFRDLDADGTLSRDDEFIDLVTYARTDPVTPHVTWRLQLDTQTGPDSLSNPPGAGDVYQAVLVRPLSREDRFRFVTNGESIDPNAAQRDFTPYVVPNPYVGSASFEPERFNISGRGERRLEFRGLPAGSIVRIYTVRGELVQTLHHDGGADGWVEWNIRTRDNLDVAPGLYIFHVDAGAIGSKTGKFAIIK